MSTESETQRAREIEAWTQSLEGESERGTALAVCAYLEDLTVELLAALMVDDEKKRSEMLKGYGPLASFSARVDLLYLLRFVSRDDADDLHRIRRVRNHFAHGYERRSFDDDKPRDLIGNLKFRPIAPDELERVKPRNMGVYSFTAAGLAGKLAREVDRARAAMDLAERSD